MGQEILTKEEPEAAHLRGVLRQIQGLLDRSTRSDSHAIAEAKAKQLIHEACAKALARPWTNGAVIDELTEKISVLETNAIDRKVDRDLLRSASIALDAHRELTSKLTQERDALRALVASQTVSVRSGGRGGGSEAFLTMLADQLGFLGEYQVPPKPENARFWAETLRAIAQTLSNPEEVTSSTE